MQAKLPFKLLQRHSTKMFLLDKRIKCNLIQKQEFLFLRPKHLIYNNKSDNYQQFYKNFLSVVFLNWIGFTPFI